MSQLLEAAAGVANACEPIPGVVTGGQPTLAHLAALKRAGCEVILDIREPMEPQPFRAAAVAAAGLEYINIPVSHGPLDDATFDRVRRTVRELAGHKRCFFYCASGNRVAAAAVGAAELGREPRARRVDLPGLERHLRLVDGDVFPVCPDGVAAHALLAERRLEEHRVGREDGHNPVHVPGFPPAAK